MTGTSSSRAVHLMAVALLAATATGCGGTAQPSRSADGPSASAQPSPTSVRDADPCSFLPKDLEKAHALTKADAQQSDTARSCSWSAKNFSMMLLVRWDSDTLVDFSQAFPTLGEKDVVLSGVPLIFGKSDVRPACAAAFFAGQGTVVEIIVGDEPPSTANAACKRVKTIGAPMIQRIREQNLLDETSTPSPS
ncbi:DUF3558 family protein [Nonomuraea sp. GTA35]|uniref:DUF3558 family protein n=1 Tax=Nonomuraea sp. GTA35 TaxID=1676746 RepID=UPI0035C2005D